MNLDFFQILILILIALLFGKDNLLPAILKKLGWSNGHKTQNQKLDDIANNHLHTVRDSLDRLEQGQDRMITLLEEFKEYGIKHRK